MKKIKLFCLVISIILLVGCGTFPESSEEERNEIFNVMKEQGIISSDLRQVDVQRKCYWNLEWCTCDNDYIYEDLNSNIISIQYEKNGSKQSHEHEVRISNNVVRNNDFKYISLEEADCSNGYYEYSNGDITTGQKYANTGNEYYSNGGYSKSYSVVGKKGLFSKKIKYNIQESK